MMDFFCLSYVSITGTDYKVKLNQLVHFIHINALTQGHFSALPHAPDKAVRTLDLSILRASRYVPANNLSHPAIKGG